MAPAGALNGRIVRALAMPGRVDAEQWRRRAAAETREQMIREICEKADIDPRRGVGRSGVDFFAQIQRSVKNVEGHLDELRNEGHFARHLPSLADGHTGEDGGGYGSDEDDHLLQNVDVGGDEDR